MAPPPCPPALLPDPRASGPWEEALRGPRVRAVLAAAGAARRAEAVGRPQVRPVRARAPGPRTRSRTPRPLSRPCPPPSAKVWVQPEAQALFQVLGAIES